ncbi:Protein mlo2 [Neolecta irregularis DAH-3]|uniref:Protein mlo2 n=1 Tax=Neolecta irregularis (strain DAH-3) TaxID=1198029 RepID=A0A1U7LMK9_NEOID|nr:Protein mlo2 [Neolecta irregularis DAH-3]|eukprot:OLL23894.1 Protein mlo2 [Neolecta irregularis DAH-3]
MSTSAEPSPAAAASGPQESITVIEYIRAQEELENEAREVYPFSHDKCTYFQGPLRQSVYACRSCDPQSPESQRGGICYSCSIECHGDHELVELFSKRDFTCDCGTDRLGSSSCRLRKNREPVNSSNQYDHNFQGRFCVCDQFYNPEEESTMFQCLLCEDWFHDTCLSDVPNHESFEWMVCKSCFEGFPYLARYQASTWSREPIPDDSTVENTDLLDSNSGKRQAQDELTAPSKKIKIYNNGDRGDCTWKRLPLAQNSHANLYLPSNFRDFLCSCVECKRILARYPMIEKEEETYQPPIDQSDNGSLLDAGTRALDSMDRSKAYHGLAAFTQLKGKLKDFFREFARTGQVVTKDDVDGFFGKI